MAAIFVTLTHFPAGLPTLRLASSFCRLPEQQRML
jgi:hypothetical protein